MIVMHMDIYPKVYSANFSRLCSYYDSTTDIYLEAWGQSFHMARYPLGPEPKERATARHEHYLAHMMTIRPGMRLLDVGCGVGGPAKEIATFADCQVTGINDNGYQVNKAQVFARQDGLCDKVQFLKADFMVDIPRAKRTLRRVPSAVSIRVGQD